MSEEQKPAPRREVFSKNEQYEKPEEKASYSVGRDTQADVESGNTVPPEGGTVGTDEQSNEPSANGNGPDTPVENVGTGEQSEQKVSQPPEEPA